MDKNILFMGILLAIMIGFLIASKIYKDNFAGEELGQDLSGLETEGLTVTPQPLPTVEIEVLQEGSGAEAAANDTVTVDYIGTLEDGVKFDSSLDRGEPFSFVLGSGKVIQGWEQGIQGMKVGEKRKLTIPPELAYGEQGVGDIISPNATLIFEVELLGINQ